MHIYRITNKIDGKIYIGLTTQSVESRWKQHLHTGKRPTAKRPGNPLSLAIAEHGAEAFLVEALAEAKTIRELMSLEIEFISQHRSSDPLIGYNRTPGGESPFGSCGPPIPGRKGKHCSEYQRRVISLKARIRSAATEGQRRKLEKQLAEYKEFSGRS